MSSCSIDPASRIQTFFPSVMWMSVIALPQWKMERMLSVNASFFPWKPTFQSSSTFSSQKESTFTESSTSAFFSPGTGDFFSRIVGGNPPSSRACPPLSAPSASARSACPPPPTGRPEASSAGRRGSTVFVSVLSSSSENSSESFSENDDFRSPTTGAFFPEDDGATLASPRFSSSKSSSSSLSGFVNTWSPSRTFSISNPISSTPPCSGQPGRVRESISEGVPEKQKKRSLFAPRARDYTSTVEKHSNGGIGVTKDNEHAGSSVRVGRKSALCGGRYAPEGRFSDDLLRARKLEVCVGNFFNKLFESVGAESKCVWPGETKKESKWDFILSIGTKDAERSLAVEVKDDDASFSTGNIAVEIECENVPSGLSTTAADVYVCRVPSSENRTAPALLVVPVENLRILVSEERHRKVVSSRDPGHKSLNVLIPLHEARKHSIAEFGAGTTRSSDKGVSLMYDFAMSLPGTKRKSSGEENMSMAM